jgi:hypothetical protein
VVVGLVAAAGCAEGNMRRPDSGPSEDAGADTLTPVDAPVAGADLEVLAPASPFTTEAGGQVAIFVRLTAAPSADVVVPVASSDAGEGSVTVTSLTFTPTNWGAPQEIQVSGVDDPDADGDQTYLLQLGPSTSMDPAFVGLGDAVSIVNRDDETAGIVLSSAIGDTTEAGGMAFFTAALGARPSADVTLSFVSSDTTEGTVSPATLTFTTANWDAPQTVTVTGVDDDLVDGTIDYTVSIDSIASMDRGYAALTGIPPVALRNIDDDSAGITATMISGTTTEAGGEARFTVVLNSVPGAAVTVPVGSNDASEGVTSVASLTFTTDNWDAPQEVIVTGQDDTLADGDQIYGIDLGPTTSSDADYAGLTAPAVMAVNVDDETAGVTVSAVSGSTTEAGDSATFTVVLNSEPTANVVLALATTDATEGTASPASLTFTPTNWRSPRTVTVTGVDDRVADGNQLYAIRFMPATSTDSDYAGVRPADVAVTNLDDDTAGIIVGPASRHTTESAGTATFTLRLASQPTDTVSIVFASSDETEGTVATGLATFTTTSWLTPQVITVTGVDDPIVDGNQTYDIVFMPATSADASYMGLVASSVRFVNDDNDTPTVVTTAPSGSTTEGGGTATFTVALGTAPTADVVIALSSSDTTEGTVAPATLTFTPMNWSMPQTVTATGVQDPIVDGNQPFNVVFAPATSTDPGYSGLVGRSVALVNVDDDTAGFLVAAASNTSETGLSISFSVALSAEPTANVTLAFTSSDTTEGTITSAPSFTFTPANWNVPQYANVQGVDDFLDDGDVVYLIQFMAAVSADPSYSGTRPTDLAIANLDDDVSGFVVNPTTIPAGTTTEAGGTATFTMRLSAQPTANVTLTNFSRDTTEGTPSAGSSLTFTPANWNIPQNVTYRGVDDSVDDGNIRYYVGWNPASSSDPLYAGVIASDVPLDNADNDAAGFIVSPISRRTNESGQTATFTVRLSSMPTANVTVNFNSNDLTEGRVSVTSLTFTTSSWSTPQTVTVTGQDDAIADGSITYQVVFSATTSADPGYAAIRPANVTVINDDNEGDCRTVNGVRWCRTGVCGQNCNTVCAAVGSTPAPDATVFAAQDSTTECNNIAGAFGFSSISLNSYTYACTEYSGSLLYCSTYSFCPANHRVAADGCSITSICGCN